MRKNVIDISLNLTQHAVGLFNLVPTFKNLLHPDQRTGLKEGENKLTVNHTVWGSLHRVAGYAPGHITVTKQPK